MKERGTRSRDLVLDAWRGISVLLVLINHVIGNRVFSSAPVGPRLNELQYYVGQLGVEFFFVISGYIITTLLVSEFEKNGVVSLSAFYVRRAFRILPLMWLVLSCIALASALGYIAVTTKSLVLSSSFLCDTRECGWFPGHMWSLAVEEQFYLIWPLALLILRFRNIEAAALIVAGTVLTIGQILGPTFHRPDIPASFACIAAGCLYATSSTLRGLIARFASVPVLVIAVLVLFAKPLTPVVAPGQFRLQILAHPWLICLVLFGSFRYRAFLEQRLIVRGLAALGLISYGVYLWQELFLGERAEYLRPSFLTWTPAFFALAILSYFLVEKPLMRIGAQLSQRLKSQLSPKLMRKAA